MLERAAPALLPGSPRTALPSDLRRSEADAGEFQRLLLSQIDQSSPAPRGVDKAKTVSRELESELLKVLFKSMWNTLPKDGLLDNGTGADFYREMWIDALAEQTCRSGSGLGLAQVIERAMEPALPASGPELR